MKYVRIEPRASIAWDPSLASAQWGSRGQPAVTTLTSVQEIHAMETGIAPRVHQSSPASVTVGTRVNCVMKTLTIVPLPHAITEVLVWMVSLTSPVSALLVSLAYCVN